MPRPIYSPGPTPLSEADTRAIAQEVAQVIIEEHERSAWGASLVGGLLCIGVGVLLGAVL